jgi:glutamyl-tRNA synthetase
MQKRVRVRFAPSPTGGLHIGGVRTVLYNYLFAKQHNGDFILRIEDTDQSRFVPGAEEYIYETLSWCGLEPDESPKHGGAYGPYKQSERKDIYRQYADELVKKGVAYYGFDTSEELEHMRTSLRSDENPIPQYDHKVRMQMKNSLTLPLGETTRLIQGNASYVIRIKMPENEIVSFIDMIRGEVHFDTSLIDDKVLLKRDGMPTYHLAVVVDDQAMQISHAFRGEEWLPSAAVHVLLWRYLFGEETMPQWAHFPLILGPSGKLSKRDGVKYGFPVFAIRWKDHNEDAITEGFREYGFLPEAFINLLAMLGWNDGSEQEIFGINELVEKFAIEKVHKGGAKFDYEKARWFNHEWIKKVPLDLYKPYLKELFESKGPIIDDDEKFSKILSLVKERCILLPDFWEQASFFYTALTEFDTDSVKPKWNEAKSKYFESLVKEFQTIPDWNSAFIEDAFKQLANDCSIKPGELQLPLRIMLVGGKFGPPVFDIAEILGKEETVARIKTALSYFSV